MNKIMPSWSDVEDWCDNICTNVSMAEIEIDMVIGISRGGLIPATMIAHMLDVKRVGSFQLASYDSTLKGAIQDLEDRNHLMTSIASAAYALVVEDIVDTGDSMKYLRKRFNHKSTKCAYAALAVKTYKAPIETWPDFYSHDCTSETWVQFPWESN